jgi:hypothetical protein
MNSFSTVARKPLMLCSSMLMTCTYLTALQQQQQQHHHQLTWRRRQQCNIFSDGSNKNLCCNSCAVLEGSDAAAAMEIDVAYMWQRPHVKPSQKGVCHTVIIGPRPVLQADAMH